MWKILDDLWYPKTNPSGFVSLRVAENSLMHKELSKHIYKHLDLSYHAFTYGNSSTGSKQVKKAIA
jgi:hypothetical protein